jgi:hypothetical protein
MKYRREKEDYRYFRAFGTMNRERTPKELHERIQNLFAKNVEMMAWNSKWFKATPVKFYGEGTTSEGKKCFHIYNMDHKDKSHNNGYHVEGTKDRGYYQLLRDSEIPLLAHQDDLDKEFQRIIKERMKGERKEIPFNQELHLEKKLIDKKWKRISKLIAKYLDMMKDYLPPKDYSNRYDTTFLLTMRIQGTDYHFDAQDQNRHYVASSDIKRVRPKKRK